MSIEFRCPNCEKKLRTGDDKAGKTAKCPQCGTGVTVPGATQVEDDFGQFPAFDEFEDGASSLPPRRGRSTPAAEVSCPMCGAKNDSRAPRCLSCGEELGDAVMAATGRLPSLRFGDVWGSAWEKWSTNLGINVAAAAISGGIFVAAYIVLIIMVMIVGFGAAAAAQGEAAGIFGILLAVFIGYFLMYVVYAYVLAGLSNFGLRQSREREVSLGALFPAASIAVSALVLTLIVMIGLTIAMIPGGGIYVLGISMLETNNGNPAVGMLLAFFGYFVMFLGWGLGWMLFWPVYYAMVDRPRSFFSPLTDGIRLALVSPKLSFLLAATHTGLLVVGMLSCYIGLLFSMPLSFVLCAVAFDRVTKHARAS